MRYLRTMIGGTKSRGGTIKGSKGSAHGEKIRSPGSCQSLKFRPRNQKGGEFKSSAARGGSPSSRRE